MCEYCERPKSHKGFMVGQEMYLNKTAANTDMRSMQVWLSDEEAPCLMVWDAMGRGAYVDIVYCPMCGRKLV